MSLIDLEPKLTTPTKQECNGQIFRYRRRAYRSSTGNLIFMDEFRFLKSKSCTDPGCEQCSWLYEDAYESGGINTIICECNPKNGDLFQLCRTNIGRDWESGFVDEWDIELVKIVQEEKPIDYE